MQATRASINAPPGCSTMRNTRRRSTLCRLRTPAPAGERCTTGSSITMYQLEFPWVLAALPLPLIVWWLLPPYREESASVRLAFFGDVAQAAGLRPRGGAVVLRTNWLQKLLAPLCWALIVLALARPHFV